MKFRNKSSGKIFEVDHLERVQGKKLIDVEIGAARQVDTTITVYVFTTGERWEKSLLDKHFVEVEEE